MSKNQKDSTQIKGSVIIIHEGMVKKGGTNPKPSTPRPSAAPKGQTPKK